MFTWKLEKVETLEERPHKWLYLALSLLLPILIMTLGVLALHVVPFGDKHSLAISDGQWYINGQLGFANLLRNGKLSSWLYGMGGLGSNSWASMSWGGIAIGSFLSLAATPETMPSVFTWVCILSMALCGPGMYLLMAYLRGHKLENLIFSTSYAMIGFLVVNCYQILFMIGPQTLPLMVLGLIRLLRGKSPLLYILSLAVCCFLNFYFGFMLCIASVLIFLAWCYVEKDNLKGRFWRVFARYAIASLIAGLLAAPMWLPALKAFTGGDGRVNQTTASEYKAAENMPFLQIFSKLFSGANSTSELVNGLPNIFCGILPVALTILYFMNKEIPVRRKRAAGALLCFYLLTFYITALTLLMHGGTHTNWFPYRYSFVFSFLILGVAAEEFLYLPTLTIAETKKCGIALLIATLLIFITKYEFVGAGTVLLDFALLFLMWLGFYLYKTKPEQAPRRVLALLLLMLVSGNLYANFVISIQKMQDWEKDLSAYSEGLMRYAPLVEGIKKADPGRFRMEKDVSESGSIAGDAGLYGFRGVGGSGPTIRMFVHKSLARLGINWYDMRHWYSEGIPAATDTLLGLKYLLSDRDLGAEKDYEHLLSTEDMKIYRNNYALSVAILADAGTEAVELSGNVFENLNLVWKTMSGGTEDIFTTEENVTFSLHTDLEAQSVTSAELRDRTSRMEAGEELDEPSGSYFEYRFTAVKDGPVYYVDTSVADSSNGLSVPAIHSCGVYAAGEEVTGTIPVTNSSATGELLRGYCANLAFAYADNAVLEDSAAELNSRDVTYQEIDSTHLTGTYTADAGEVLLFTLVYDEGWTCLIDGKQVPIEKAWNLFMSVELPEGTHTYEMRYLPPWLDYGLYLSGAAFIGMLVFLPVSRKRRRAELAVLDADSLETADECETAASESDDEIIRENAEAVAVQEEQS